MKLIIKFIEMPKYNFYDFEYKKIEKTLTRDFDESNDTIENIKVIIQDLEGIPFFEQILSFKEKILEDNKTIADYNICSGDTLFLFFIIRGGGNIDYIKEEEDKKIGFDIKLLKRDELKVNLIWFDKNLINEENYYYYNKLKVDVVGGFHALDDLNILKKYLEIIKNKNISFILLTSGKSGKDVIKICSQYSFIKEIIIFCYNYKYNEHYIKEYPKLVKKVFTDIYSVYKYIKSFEKKHKNFLINTSEKNKYFFSLDEIKMDKQIQQCPFITASEYDNCYFLVHRAYSFFFKDINDKNSYPHYNSWNLTEIMNFIYKLKFKEENEKKIFFSKFCVLTHFTTNEQFVEKSIRKYTDESNFCYLMNRVMRNFEPGLISFAYYIGPLLFGLNKYVKENPNFAMTKNMILYRIMKCPLIDFYLFKINLGHIICFPSLTSTSSEPIEFKPTNLANKINSNNFDETVMIKMLFNFKYQEGDISPGIIIEDKKNKNGEYLSCCPNEKEVILFPFTFARINKIEKEIENGIEFQKISLEIINKKTYHEYTLKNDVQHRILFNNLDKNS